MPDERKQMRFSVQVKGSSFRGFGDQKMVTAESPQEAIEQVRAEGFEVIRCVKMPEPA